ncbi:hypothetical protein [Priestia filamentosa]|uniref:hypothetical protein n=2 Tax=Priestia filamentosa TaxID=1402861 RepID=UPI000A08A0A8|nr:hypothetical protein [Priestia filamentosa]SMF31911.1 hypothetical protein SAMN06296056_102649 [Priestia filamentosa]
MILELENLSALCEEKSQKSEEMGRQRFYEGMAVAYTTLTIKLKGECDYIEPAVIDELYKPMEKHLNRVNKRKQTRAKPARFAEEAKKKSVDLPWGLVYRFVRAV